MHDRIVIGVLASPDLNKDGNVVTSLIDHYRKAIVSKGCIPLIIPPLANIDYTNDDIPELTLMEKNMYLKFLSMCDGLLIPGGSHIYNYIYYVASEALKKDIPILGTCMGMQVLAIIDSNYEKCLFKNETNIEHSQKNVKYVHKIKIEKDSKLYHIIGQEEIEVNSNHHYHIDNLHNFIATSYAPDGIIESIELPSKKYVIGVQWHPEKMFEYDEYQDKLINSFIETCSNKESIFL